MPERTWDSSAVTFPTRAPGVDLVTGPIHSFLVLVKTDRNDIEKEWELKRNYTYITSARFQRSRSMSDVTFEEMIRSVCKAMYSVGRRESS